MKKNSLRILTLLISILPGAAFAGNAGGTGGPNTRFETAIFDLSDAIPIASVREAVNFCLIAGDENQTSLVQRIVESLDIQGRFRQFPYYTNIGHTGPQSWVRPFKHNTSIQVKEHTSYPGSYATYGLGSVELVTTREDQGFWAPKEYHTADSTHMRKFKEKRMRMILRLTDPLSQIENTAVGKNDYFIVTYDLPFFYFEPEDVSKDEVRIDRHGRVIEGPKIRTVRIARGERFGEMIPNPILMQIRALEKEIEKSDPNDPATSDQQKMLEALLAESSDMDENAPQGLFMTLTFADALQLLRRTKEASQSPSDGAAWDAYFAWHLNSSSDPRVTKVRPVNMIEYHDCVLARIGIDASQPPTKVIRKEK